MEFIKNFAAPGDPVNPREAICKGVGKVINDAGECVNSVALETTADRVWRLAAQVTNWLLIGVGVICVMLIIVAGIQYATSGGDAEKVKKAKNRLLYACIGLAVALLAGIVVNIVGSIATTISTTK